MIGWLHGSLLARSISGQVLVGVGGVGYEVSVPTSLLAGLGEIGGEVTLFVHTHVREDAIVLFGFSSMEDRDWFETLLGAHGVGPSLALAVLSTMQSRELAQVLAAEDVDALCAIPGVGKKTAQRLILDLRGRIDLVSVQGYTADDSGAVSARSEVREALSELGYGSEEIRRAMDATRDVDASAEDLLRAALRELAATR